MVEPSTSQPTAREIEILQLVAEGHTNAEIAAALYLAPETVKTHIRRLLIKLNARSRAQAVAEGIRQGWIA